MAALCGKVYAIGGFDGNQRMYSVEAYDPFHNCWTEVSVVCVLLVIFCCTLISCQELYLTEKGLKCNFPFTVQIC